AASDASAARSWSTPREPTSITRPTASSSPPARTCGAASRCAERPCSTSRRRCSTTCLAVAKDMDGKVLEGVFEPEFVDRHPIRYVSTDEVGERPGATASASAADEASQAEIERGLRALGYVGGASEERTADAEGREKTAEESSPEIHNNLGRIHARDGEPE